MPRLTDFFLARSLAPWLRLRALALLVATCALALPAGAQDVVQAITALTQSSRPSAAASEAPPQADPKLVQQAARATQKDDERILAQVTARLARSPSFRHISPSVQAGVAVLSGTVPDNESRQLAAKVVGAVEGWYVPRYVIEGDAKRKLEAKAPDLKSIADLAKYASVFKDQEEPSKGRFYNCPAGWVRPSSIWKAAAASTSMRTGPSPWPAR